MITAYALRKPLAADIAFSMFSAAAFVSVARKGASFRQNDARRFLKLMSTRVFLRGGRGYKAAQTRPDETRKKTSCADGNERKGRTHGNEAGRRRRRQVRENKKCACPCDGPAKILCEPFALSLRARYGQVLIELGECIILTLSHIHMCEFCSAHGTSSTSWTWSEL